MKVAELIKILNAKEYNIADSNIDIVDGYCGDFLSFVMGRAPKDSAWYTIMSNVNVAAVANLCEVGVIVLCENVVPDKNLIEKTKSHGINLIGTSLSIYHAVKAAEI